MHIPELEDDASASFIDFYAEDVSLPDEIDQERWSTWIRHVIEQSGCQLAQLSYIFCSDAYLHRINLEYLQHDTYTDIITFPYADPPVVAGDIFISTDRVKDNADSLSEPYHQELARVVIHGVLHLCGQADKSEAEAAVMRLRENEALARLLHMK